MRKRGFVLVIIVCMFLAVVLAPRINARINATPVKSTPGVVEQGMPDLIVRSDVLRDHWVVRVEDLPAEFCSVQEGGITPGRHPLIRFTVTTPNIGTADVFVGDPNEHFAAGDGLFEFATCHKHYHFRHYALYELIDPASGIVWKAAKRGFCMLDTDPNPQWLGGPNPGPPQYRNCGALGIPGYQGISAGWADTYNLHLGGQYFVLDGGDGQPAVQPGYYTLRITVNPPFRKKGNEPCPQVDSQGFCHQLPESDYTNNVGEVTIYIPARPGRTGVGPEAGSPHVTPEPVD
jgi:hypothetical protein